MSHTEKQDVTYYNGHVIEVNGKRYAMERTCRPVRKEIEWPTQEGPVNRVVYECSECEVWIGVTSSYCFNCGARIVREGA